MITKVGHTHKDGYTSAITINGKQFLVLTLRVLDCAFCRQRCQKIDVIYFDHNMRKNIMIKTIFRTNHGVFNYA